MNKVTLRIITALIIIWCSASHAAQICNTQAPASTPTSQFIVIENGLVIDTHTTLMWKRCPEGYTFNDNSTINYLDDDTCVENVVDPTLLSWQKALQNAVAINSNTGFGGYSDWRVPNMKELFSIVEMKCANPAVNSLVFPGVLTGAFWSSSSDTESSHPPLEPNARNSWAVDFDLGHTNSLNKASLHFLRLVRDFQ